MINLKMVVLRRTVIVKVVSVPIAVNVVIGTLRAILKPGNGCAITKIGNRQIGSVTVIIFLYLSCYNSFYSTTKHNYSPYAEKYPKNFIVFMSISNVVMVPLVFFILIMIIFMVMLFMIIIVSVKTMFVLSYAYEIPLFVRVCAISC